MYTAPRYTSFRAAWHSDPSSSMKSAIFQDSREPNESRLKKLVVKKKSRSQSPFVASSGTSHVNWNLEEMIASYMSSGVLPALLSPSLPARFKVTKDEKKDSNETENLNEHLNNSDLETIPISLLSPTLPNIFDEHTLPEIAHPLPKKANELNLVLESKPRTRHIRWVNKSGSDKPRFLLRINLDTLHERYKSVFHTMPAPKSPPKLPAKPQRSGQTHSSTSLQGLAIFESRKARDADDAQSRVESRLESKTKPNPRKSLLTRQESTSDSLATSTRNSHDKLGPKNQWAQIARDLRTRYELMSSKDSLFSIVMQLDYILCITIYCDVEDLKTNAKNITSNEGNWHNLLGEIVLFVGRLEKYIKTNIVSDKKKAFFSFIVAILAMQKATILRRQNQNLERVIKSYGITRESSSEAQYKVIEVQRQVIRNHQKIEDHCKEAQSFFAKCPPTSTVFPKSWSRRVPTSSRSSNASISPNTDTYYLPLGPYSELRESCAFLYSCAREFLEIYSHDINGGARYTLCAGQNILFD